MKAGAVIVAMLAGMKRFMCAPGAKLQLPQLWHPILAGQWQSTKISRIYYVSVCAHTHTHYYMYSLWQLASKSTQEAEVAVYNSDWLQAHVDVQWGDEKRDACDQVGREVLGWLLGGWLPTLCVTNPWESVCHCGSLLVHQPESWAGISDPQSLWQAGLFLS